MTIPAATSYFCRALQSAAYQLAATAQWQSVVGAASQAAALGRVVFVDSGVDYEAEQPTSLRAETITGQTIDLKDGTAWAHVGLDMPMMATSMRVPHSFSRSGSILIRLAIPRPAGGPAASFTEFCNTIGTIETQMLGTFGGPTNQAHIAGDVRIEVPAQPPPKSWAFGLMFAHLTLDWRDIP